MDSGIRKSGRGDKTVYAEMGIWYDATTDQIRLSIPRSDWFVTTVRRDPKGKRGHPNLFAKLARCLKEAGAPYPPNFEEAADADRI